MSGVDTSAVTAVATAASIGLSLVILLALGAGLSSAAIDSDTTRLSGTVTDEDGQTIFGANVTVNGSSEASRTNADGFYSLELEGGEHEVTVETAGHEPKTWTETLSNGSWTRTDVTLTAEPTELEGTVTNPDDEPVEGATVRIAGTDLEATTDENGSYAFEIDPGSYSLETSADGYNTRRSTVTVRESQLTTRDVQLSDGGRSDDDADEESETDDENDVDGESEDDDHEERSDGDENDTETDVDHDESRSDESVNGDTRGDDSSPATNREQVLTVLILAGTFLATMITAATVGLYRNRSR
ncbi:carboxypeptidase regulatory-like domain-containing protein [Natronorubrum texcoconense]|uniref:Carboxypeptidase regulatory-like domain-containing protein n=1 Tax=Natronorubrum texcoconense TaxID=1095776 RepID=A0A1G8X6W1_9EURY|nr:carboxypeptidase regulatory-like domain-containing protein [Natronorubrum texcoconense]SDJ86201.1 Carboxypeptidase regulatory-like domain-containing protein [Natronorubrum texcoconense]